MKGVSFVDRKRRVVGRAVLLLAVVTLATSVVPGVASAATSADKPWQCVDPTATKPAAGSTFVWGFGGGTTQTQAVADIVPAFEKDTGLKVTYVGASSAETMAKIVAANG